MSTDIQIFTNQEFNKEIRAIEINNEPWFVGKDVAEALGYSDTDKALRTHVDIEDKQILNPADLAGLRNNANFQVNSPRGLMFINEAGLYSLTIRSSLPNAKKFAKWLTHDATIFLFVRMVQDVWSKFCTALDSNQNEGGSYNG